MARLTRRDCLGLILGTSTAVPAFFVSLRAQRGLDQFVVPAPKCATLTPAVVRERFRAGAPARTSFLDPAAPGTRYVLTGTVTGQRCGLVKNARIDFWQADSKGMYDDRGHRFRGHQLTDAEGRFKLESIVPGPLAGQAPRLYATIAPSSPPGGAAFSTVLFYPDRAENVRDSRFAPDLLMRRSPTSTDTLIFDFMLDL